jgi:DNA-binding CsgD family transcriptional regulator/PAS domain-containing protein
MAREQQKETLGAIDVDLDLLNSVMSLSLLIRAVSVDSDGVIVARTATWDEFVGNGGDPLVQVGAVGTSIVDHFHHLAVEGNLYARDALVRLLSVLQGVKRFAALDYPPSWPGYIMRNRLTMAELSGGGALINHISLQPTSLGIGQGAFPRLKALASLVRADWASAWQLTQSDPPMLTYLAPGQAEVVDRAQRIPLGGLLAEVVSEGYQAHPSRVRERFPEDDWLTQHDADSFIGSALYDSSANPIGVIGVSSRVPIEVSPGTEVTFKSIAAQISAVCELGVTDVSEKRSDILMRMFERCDLSVLIFDVDQRLFEVNHVGRSMLELNFGTSENLTLPDLLPDDVDEGEMREELQSSGTWSIERPLIMPGGESIFARLELRSLDELGIELVVHPVSEQPAAFESTSTRGPSVGVMSSLPSSIFRLNEDGVCIDYSPGRVTPIFWKGSPVGKSMSETLPADLRDRITGMINAALNTRETQADEVTFEHEGESYFRGLRVVPASDHEVLLIISDYTAEREQHERRESREKMQEIEGKAEHLMVRHNPYGLTFRELSVLHLVVDGLGDKEIAKRLGVSIFTVNKHVAKVLEKMNASSRTEAAVRAARENLVL